MFFAKWRCKKFGHNWLGIDPSEHFCVREICLRCSEFRWLHLTGVWPHTCGLDHLNYRTDPKEV